VLIDEALSLWTLRPLRRAHRISGMPMT
jgi:hypothetical protein